MPAKDAGHHDGGFVLVEEGEGLARRRKRDTEQRTRNMGDCVMFLENKIPSKRWVRGCGETGVLRRLKLVDGTLQ